MTGIVTQVKIKRGLFFKMLNDLNQSKQKIQKKISSLKPDICHFHGTSTYMLGYKGAAILTLHGIPEKDASFTSGNLTFFKSLSQSIVEGYCRKKANHIIIISKYITDILNEDINGKTWLIENPVSPEFFSLKIQPTKVIFFAGMVSKRKNVLGLLKAFKKAVKTHKKEEVASSVKSLATLKGKIK